MGAATVAISYVMRLCILHNELPESVFLGKFVIYISCGGVNMLLHMQYIFVFIDMFVDNIIVSASMCLCML